MSWRETQAKQEPHRNAIFAKVGQPASPNGKSDFDEDAAQERRRQERLKRKKEERRDDSFEEEDSELLLGEPKKVKRKKKKKERPALWLDEQIVDELEEVFDGNGQQKKNLRFQEDWLGNWDE